MKQEENILWALGELYALSHEAESTDDLEEMGCMEQVCICREAPNGDHDIKYIMPVPNGFSNAIRILRKEFDELLEAE